VGKTIATPHVIRACVDEEQKKMFQSHEKEHDDVESLGDNQFLIRSGWTVDCPAYLQGLWNEIAGLGGVLQKETVTSFASLKDFDQIIVAAGVGSLAFLQDLKCTTSVLKGQVLNCELLTKPPCSLIGNGYVAFLQGSNKGSLGSTYERVWTDEKPDQAFAEKEILAKTSLFYPEASKLLITGCRVGFRLIRKGRYFPILAKPKSGVWALTALGSRGLLYHALLGKCLASAVINDDEDQLLEYSI